MKITFEDTRIADQALQHGFVAFRISMIPDQTERDKFTSLITYFSGYKSEEHTTTDCPLKDNKYYSTCPKIGHAFRKCS